MKKLSLLVLVCSLSLINTGCVALFAGGAVGTGAVVAADSRSTGTMIDDEAIELRSVNIVSNNREIYSASKIDVTSVNGRVLLTGQCKDQDYINYIEDRISKLPQVKEVINRIAKIETVSISQRAFDTWLTSKVKTQLLFGEEINSGRFKVITENNTVYLLGVVSKDEAARAVNVARNVDGVVKVVKVFEYLSENSKVAPIFKENKTDDYSNTTTSNKPVSISSAGSNASEDIPIYYEEASIIEQPVSSTSISAPSNNEVKYQEPVQSEIQSEPVKQTEVVTESGEEIAPAGSSNVQEEYFILE